MKSENLPLKAGILIKASSKSTPLDHLPAQEVMSLIKDAGALQLSGYASSTDSFFDYTEKLGLSFIDYRGGAFQREEVNRKSTLMTVTGHKRGFPIPLHGELYYQRSQPDLLCFYCVSSALLGGATTIANAREVYELLPASTKKFFEDHPVKYIRRMPPSEWNKVYKTTDQEEVAGFCEELGMTHEFDSNGFLTTEYVASAFYQREDSKAFLNNILPNYYIQKLGRNEAGVLTHDNKEIPAEIIKSVEKVLKAQTLKVRLRPGEILIVNNRSTLHGRRSFVGKRQIYLRMGSFK